MSNKGSYKVALVANTAWSIYNFRLGLMRRMKTKNIEVIAIAPRDDYANKITAEGIRYIPIYVKAHSTSVIDDIRTWKELYFIYKNIQPDLIIHYTIKMNIYGSIASSWLGIKSISVVTGLGRTFQLSRLTQPIINLLYKYASTKNEEVWVLNEEDKKELIKRDIVAVKKLFVLPSEGVNTNRFLPSPSIGDKKLFRFLYAGRLLKEKGIPEFIQAAVYLKKKYRNLVCEVVGFVNPDDSMSMSLEELRDWQAKGVINYMGSHEDIRPFINRADCVVYPSYYKEGVSRILLEAASMAKPIITTDHPGCREVVEHQRNGLLISVQDNRALIEAMEEMMNLSSEDRKIMGGIGRQLVRRNYDERKIIDIYFSRLLYRYVALSSSQQNTQREMNE